MKTNNILQLLNTHRIVIPPIQRDYAQGRNTGKIPHIRERFLDAIVYTLRNDALPPLELDFVYGYMEKDITNDKREISVFKPLDGQQRLTTLFLIHWYIANKEGKSQEAKPLLEKFSYATRQSSRSFCTKLVSFIPEPDGTPINKQIRNQSWFFSAWQNDATIASMLVMLKEIEDKFNGLENIWPKLTGDTPRIVFHLLSMEDLGLPDDLYIKMNARGKGLTDFEHFKSQFSEMITPEAAKIFDQKIDKEWSDLFWNIFKDKLSTDIAKEVDDGFLSFFWYITDILIAKENIVCSDSYWLDVIATVYKNSPQNVQFLFNTLNLFERIEKTDSNYFDELFYIKSEDFAITKTRIFFNSPQTNLFRKCAETYGFGDKKNAFSVGEQLFLYAFIFMNLNERQINNEKFRLLRNLFSSSEDQLRNEYLPMFLYDDVEAIIENDKLSAKSKLSTRQFKEEQNKADLIIKHPELKEPIYKLEDHVLLRGNIALFDFDTDLPAYADQFHKIFTPGCNYSEISKAMLTLGDYTQSYGNLRRFGNRNSSTWRELFTQSENRKGFEITRSILKSYLQIFSDNSSETDQSTIITYLNNYTANPHTPKDFRYYYIKYENFSTWDGNQTEGFYWWDNYLTKPYESMMLFKRQFNGRHWSPFLLELSELDDSCSLDNYGNLLQYTSGDLMLFVQHLNEGYKFSSVDEFSSAKLSQLMNSNQLNKDGILLISQNQTGVDIEDRIIKCCEFFQTIIPVIQ